jgi:hypothetical protein
MLHSVMGSDFAASTAFEGLNDGFSSQSNARSR